MQKTTLKLTAGLPRSGKSSWAKTQGVPIVNPDSIRLALHGQPFYGPAEPFVWAIAKVMVSALFKAGHTVVILDATNVTEAKRKEWVGMADSLELVIFPTSVEECKRRATALNQDYLLPIIDRMASEWDLGGIL